MSTVSNGYVSQLQASYRKSKLGASSGSTGSKYFDVWKIKYPNLSFSASERAVASKGVGNMTISNTQLREIESDVTKRVELEEILKDCNKAAAEMKVRGGQQLVSQGFFYSKEGELQGWSVAKNYSGANQKYTCVLNKEQPTRWYSAMTVYNLVKDPYASDWSSRFGK